MRSFLAMLRPLPRGNWGGFSFEIESLSGGSAGVALHYVATGAASRLRLKVSMNRGLKLTPGCGNWGGFSFEIERLMFLSKLYERPRGNWGGFSFEIERARP